jgi:hypothetical protein
MYSWGVASKSTSRACRACRLCVCVYACVLSTDNRTKPCTFFGPLPRPYSDFTPMHLKTPFILQILYTSGYLVGRMYICRNGDWSSSLCRHIRVGPARSHLSLARNSIAGRIPGHCRFARLFFGSPALSQAQGRLCEFGSDVGCYWH